MTGDLDMSTFAIKTNFLKERTAGYGIELLNWLWTQNQGIDLSTGELILPNNPVAGGSGACYWNSSTKKLFIHDGATWRYVTLDHEPGGGGGGADVKSGVEISVFEGSTRNVTFTTSFGGVPAVTLTVVDTLDRECWLSAINRTTSGFTIYVKKTQGGAAKARDIAWIATDAGNP